MKTEWETVASNDVPTDFMQNKSSQGKMSETTASKQTNKQTNSLLQQKTMADSYRNSK